MNWTAETILKATQGRLLYGETSQAYTGVGIDSRTIAAGELFVAIQGENHDGHTFVPEVINQGIRGIVIRENIATSLNHDQFRSQAVTCIAVTDTIRALGDLAAHQRRQVDIPVVAITGSNGKTTTRQMTALVMAQRYHTLATLGNLNNEIGLPLTLFNLTTKHQAVVVELGMNHGGEINRLGAICQPTIGMIINVGPAHLEFLRTLEGVALAKGELIDQVVHNGSVILNGDDPHVAGLAEKAQSNVVLFGISGNARVRAEAVQETAEGVGFNLILPGEYAHVQLNTPGRFMVHNALAAATVGYLLGLNAAEIKTGLEAFVPSKGRLHILQTIKGIHIIDDTYNANPQSMAAAMDTLHAVKGAQRGFIALGDMLELGAQAEEFHYQLGQRAARYRLEKLYITGDHAHAVAQGAQAGGMDQVDIFIGDKTAIAQNLLDRLAPGDWVLVKGSRGMAMETIVEDIFKWANG